MDAFRINMVHYDEKVDEKINSGGGEPVLDALPGELENRLKVLEGKMKILEKR